jgi:hypothetical protein
MLGHLDTPKRRRTVCAVIDPNEADRLSRAVIDEVRRQLRDLQLVVDQDTAGHVYCVAGVARSLALYDSVALLEAHGRADVAGVLARIVLESHHISLYALLGGVEAVEALEADLGHYMNLIASENVEVWGEAASAEMRAQAAKFGTPKVLPFKTLRERLQILLDESHTPVDLTLWYTLLYRGESTYSVHGVGQLQRCLDHDQRAIVLDPPPILQRVSYAATVTEIVGHVF